MTRDRRECLWCNLLTISHPDVTSGNPFRGKSGSYFRWVVIGYKILSRAQDDSNYYNAPSHIQLHLCHNRLTKQRQFSLLDAQILWLLAFIALGLFNGVLAGLLGIGGGMIIVPAMLWLAPKLGVAQDHVMHVALGTSMATICFIAISSARSHHKRGSVSVPLLKVLIPGIAIGGLIGAVLANFMNTEWLAWVFSIFAMLVGIKMLTGATPQAKGERTLSHQRLPAGVFMGVISSLVGIGGGSVVVPYLLYHKEKLVTAIGTAAACGLPLAVTATIGYIITGWNIEQLPAYHLGYVYWPAMIAIALGSVVTAPVGAYLAHKLPTKVIKQIFAVLLIIVAIKIISEHL